MVKSLKMSNFTNFHNVFWAICILKSFTSHISVVVCNFFEFGIISKWCNREWVNQLESIWRQPSIKQAVLWKIDARYSHLGKNVTLIFDFDLDK